MPTNVETGIMAGPEGYQIAWCREDVSPEAARLFRRESEARTLRVLTYKGKPGGSAVIGHFGVPGPALHWLLHEAEDAPGKWEEVLSVEAIDGGATWERMD